MVPHFHVNRPIVGRNEINAAKIELMPLSYAAVDDTVTHTEMRDGVGRLFLFAGDWVCYESTSDSTDRLALVHTGQKDGN